MELDETDPAIWLKLENETEEYSPEYGPRRTNHIDLVPPLSLDGKLSFTPPASPSLSWHPSVHVRSLHEKLQNISQVGVIHMSHQNDSTGSVLRLVLLLT